MSMTVEQFGKAAVASGLVEAEDLKTFWNSLPAETRPKQGDLFAKLLADRGVLTPFQAQEILAGRAEQLQLGQYMICEKIGQGGMGMVYRAQHKKMKRVVAIKVLTADRIRNEKAVKRFKREVEAAARLTHPNIVQSYDSGEQNGKYFLVMEYVEGTNLSKLVKKQGPRPLDEAVNYFLQAARGLGFAHKAGVIHRDIKPSNLFLDKAGNVKILDMGLARFEEEEGDNVEKLTVAGEVMGTADYMAPEQWLDMHTADARSDIYSLGCTFYRLLVGETPYGGDTAMQKLMAHSDAPVPKLRQKRPEVPEALDAIYMVMMAKKPEDRYQTCDELLADLENYAKPGAKISAFDRLKAAMVVEAPPQSSTGTQTNPALRPGSPASATAEPADSESAGTPWFKQPVVLVGIFAVLVIIVGGVVILSGALK